MNVFPRVSLVLGALALVACSPPPNPPADVVSGDAASDVPGTMDVATNDVAPDVAPDEPAPIPDGPNFVPLLIAGNEDWLSRIPADIRRGYSFRAPYIQNLPFAPNSCEVQEGCALPGDRRVLRFTLATPNRGNQDMILGPPTAAGRDPAMFEYSPCHGHYHLRGYADYRLYDMAGHEVARGHKQSFCIEDSAADPNALTDPATGMPFNVDLPPADVYTCNNQGLHAGWLDAYGAHLPCQWIDITGLPAGHYRIHVSLNADHVVTEANYNDNQADLEVDVPAPSGNPPPQTPLDACASGETGPERECGWSSEADPRACTPGSMVTVGCNPMCTPSMGICEGNTVIRVCASARTCRPDDAGACVPPLPYCSHTEALAANDDACGSQCSQVTFTCPPSGYYRVLTGANRSGDPYTCRLPFASR